MKKKEEMEKIQELAELFLPEGILEYFEYTGYERKSKEESKPYGEVTIMLVEKNIVPKLPAEYCDRKIRQKGFKEIRVDDFPVRGKKVKLLLRRKNLANRWSRKTLQRGNTDNISGYKVRERVCNFF